MDRISAQDRRRVSIAEEARLREAEELAFNAKPLVMFGLPIRKPTVGLKVWERTNGDFKISIETRAGSKLGLPYGRDRIIPIYLATRAVKEKTRTIVFEHAGEILQLFNLTDAGKLYRDLENSFKRIYDTTIYFGRESELENGRLVSGARYSFIDEYSMWFQKGRAQQMRLTGFENVVVLSERFYDVLTRSKIPFSLDAIRCLASNPGALDFYMWLSWRSFCARKPERIPLFGDRGLIAQVGVTSEFSRERKFRERIRIWLQEVHGVRSALGLPPFLAGLSRDGQFLELEPSRTLEAFSTFPQT